MSFLGATDTTGLKYMYGNHVLLKYFSSLKKRCLVPITLPYQFLSPTLKFSNPTEKWTVLNYKYLDEQKYNYRILRQLQYNKANLRESCKLKNEKNKKIYFF